MTDIFIHEYCISFHWSRVFREFSRNVLQFSIKYLAHTLLVLGVWSFLMLLSVVFFFLSFIFCDCCRDAAIELIFYTHLIFGYIAEIINSNCLYVLLDFVCHMQMETLLFLLSKFYACLFSFFLIILDRTSYPILNRNSESRYCCLQHFSFSYIPEISSKHWLSKVWHIIFSYYHILIQNMFRF